MVCCVLIAASLICLYKAFWRQSNMAFTCLFYVRFNMYQKKCLLLISNGLYLSDSDGLSSEFYLSFVIHIRWKDMASHFYISCLVSLHLTSSSEAAYFSSFVFPFVLWILNLESNLSCIWIVLTSCSSSFNIARNRTELVSCLQGRNCIVEQIFQSVADVFLALLTMMPWCQLC